MWQPCPAAAAHRLVRGKQMRWWTTLPPRLTSCLAQPVPNCPCSLSWPIMWVLCVCCICNKQNRIEHVYSYITSYITIHVPIAAQVEILSDAIVGDMERDCEWNTNTCFIALLVSLGVVVHVMLHGITISFDPYMSLPRHPLNASPCPQVTQNLTDMTDVLSLNGTQVKVNVKLAGSDIISGLKVSRRGQGHISSKQLQFMRRTDSGIIWVCVASCIVRCIMYHTFIRLSYNHAFCDNCHVVYIHVLLNFIVCPSGHYAIFLLRGYQFCQFLSSIICTVYG